MSDKPAREAASEAIESIQQASHGSGPAAVDSIFDGFARLSEAFHAMGATRSENLRKRRNERARLLYAINKGIGRLPKRKAEPLPSPKYEAPTECFCFAVRMPPCSFCTREIEEE